MSHRWRDWAVGIALKGPCKHVLVELADMANDAGECWPGHEHLAQRTGDSTRTIRRCLARLEAAGLISRKRRPGRNGYRTSDLITLCEEAAYRTDGPVGGPPRLADSQTGLADSQSSLPARESANPSKNHQEPSAAAQLDLALGLPPVPPAPEPSLIVRYEGKYRLEKRVPREFRHVDKRTVAKHWLGTTELAVAERRKPLFLDALWSFWRQLVDDRRPLDDAKAELNAAMERIRAGAVQQVPAAPRQRQVVPARPASKSPRRQGRERSPALARIDAAMRLREAQIEEEESNGPGHNAGGPIIDM